jgi:hypothetical protein
MNTLAIPVGFLMVVEGTFYFMFFSTTIPLQTLVLVFLTITWIIGLAIFLSQFLGIAKEDMVQLGRMKASIHRKAIRLVV